MLLSAAMLACENDEKRETPNGTFEVSSSGSIFFEKTGGDSAVAVTVTGALIYVPMSSDSSWCKITEKTESGFRFSVIANSQNEERTAELVVAAVGFPFVRIRVVQAAGDPRFSMAEAERSKAFSQTGGEMAVSVNGNIPYELAPLDDWCTYKDVTPSGFTLVADANPGIAQRTTSVTVTPAAGFGFSETIIINVRQSGTPVLQNGWFTDGLTGWETSDTSGIFKRATDQYLPTGAPAGANYIANGVAATVGFEGCITQKLTNIPDGTYIFSCDVAGRAGKSPTTDGIYLVAFDKDDNEIAKKKLPFPEGSWWNTKNPAKQSETQLSVIVTGGECKVGIYAVAAGGENSTMDFKVLNFDFQ
ncbi:MAG: hypothetical protein LBH84_04115 [Prevotellaceae bacterium]|nr:hypothetical protein [Prevotellaceae bacterium]